MVSIPINQRILGTKSLLVKMGITDNDRCTFCDSNKESILHLFFECDIIQTFWQSIKSWINVKCPCIDTQWTKQDILLGNINFKNIVYKFLVFVKYYIYTCKMNSTLPILESLKRQLNAYYKMEKYNAKLTSSLQKFEKTWSPLSSLVLE